MNSAMSNKSANGPVKDRRRNFRYALPTSLRYRVAGEIIGPWKNGRTLNMSASGILVGGGETLLRGARVELMMDWPGLLHGATGMRLVVFGEVVRSEGSGTAVRILRHEFRAAPERSAIGARSTKLHRSFTAA
jgi:hypothetical protein